MPCDPRAPALCAVLLLAAACSSNHEPLGSAPNAFVRKLPTYSLPSPDGGLDAAEPGPVMFPAFDASVPCCHKTFSFPVVGGESAVSVRGDAVGNEAGGLPLVKKGGKWQLTTCLPLGQGGTYYYELQFPAQENDGGVAPDSGAPPFFDVRYNPAEPTTQDVLLGTVNVFTPTASCK